MIKLTGIPIPGGTDVGIGIADIIDTIILNILIYVDICWISLFILFILSSLFCIILIALSLANLALFNLVGSPDSLAAVIKALVSFTNLPTPVFWAIISDILFVKRRVIIGTKDFAPFCNIAFALSFLAFLFSALVLALRASLFAFLFAFSSFSF